MSTDRAAVQDESLTRTAVALAAATVVAWIVLVAVGHDGPAWLIQPLLGLATAVTAWRAGGASTRNVRALIALVIGVVAVLSFLGWVISEL